MQVFWNIQTSAMTLVLAALLLSSCGDTDPDLDAPPVFNDSLLQLSVPVERVELEWQPLEDVEEYRVTQIAGAEEVLLAEGVIVTEATVVLDVSTVEYDVAGTNFRVEADDPVDGWVEVQYVLRLFPTARTLQFEWAPVEDATQYRLTQTQGSFEVLGQGQQTYPRDQTFARVPVPVHLVDWSNSRFVLEALVAGDWTFVGEQDLAGESGRFIAAYTETDVFSPQLAFGWSVALSENGAFMAVGAIGETSVPNEQKVCPDSEPDCEINDDLIVIAENAGGVYVYDLVDNGVTLVKSPNTDINDFFGRAVALSDDGETLVVAALGEDSDARGVFAPDSAGFAAGIANNEAVDSGAVYVFHRAAGNDWELAAYLKAPNAEAGDFFGWDIALSGDGSTLAVGAVREDSDAVANPDNNDLTDSGSVYVYRRTGDTWAEDGVLKAANADAGDAFGHALALGADGTHLAASAYSEAGRAGQPEDNGLPNSGAVYTFARGASGWAATGYLKASNADSGDRFGQSVAFDGAAELLAVGAPFEDAFASGQVVVGEGAETANVGAVYLFSRAGSGASTEWTQQSSYLKPSNPNELMQFGQSVAISADARLVLAGAWGERSSAIGIDGNQNADNVTGSGAAYLFASQSDQSNWAQISYIKANDRLVFQYFGSEVDMAAAGELLVVSGSGVRPDGLVSGFPGFVYLY